MTRGVGGARMCGGESRYMGPKNTRRQHEGPGGARRDKSEA